ncbi:Uncharacterized protein APZ42_018899 [Daphnia magna]|uniref:Uncharacterized protein n=1 Tax=Daphnia magna TaxID=35525 RepID=A0A162CGU9_9CRUS|nr:Uncharacterized protein APZ42_018899 [Daphnia magna]
MSLRARPDYLPAYYWKYIPVSNVAEKPNFVKDIRRHYGCWISLRSENFVQIFKDTSIS